VVAIHVQASSILVARSLGARSRGRLGLQHRQAGFDSRWRLRSTIRACPGGPRRGISKPTASVRLRASAPRGPAGPGAALRRLTKRVRLPPARLDDALVAQRIGTGLRNRLREFESHRGLCGRVKRLTRVAHNHEKARFDSSCPLRRCFSENAASHKGARRGSTPRVGTHGSFAVWDGIGSTLRREGFDSLSSYRTSPKPGGSRRPSYKRLGLRGSTPRRPTLARQGRWCDRRSDTPGSGVQFPGFALRGCKSSGRRRPPDTRVLKGTHGFDSLAAHRK
jgi:hypothetical protein